MQAPCNSASISRPQAEDMPRGAPHCAMHWRGLACQSVGRKQKEACNSVILWQQLAALLCAISLQALCCMHGVHLEWPQGADRVGPCLKAAEVP